MINRIRRDFPSIGIMAVLCSLLLGNTAWGLDEAFELYAPPQFECMGKTITSNATGILSTYYNPAGLAKTSRRKLELTFVDLVGNLGLSALSAMWTAQSFGAKNLIAPTQNSPGTYNYVAFGGAPGFSTRNFGGSLLANYRFAAISDGSETEVDSVIDLGTTLGVAMGFYGGVLKVGVAGKFLLRNQLKGTFANSALSASTYDSLSTEGYGFGVDAGILVTLPYRLFPTFGFAIRDIAGTEFTATRLLNSESTGAAPDGIGQSISFGGSIHPRLGRKFNATISAEFRNFRRLDFPMRKKIHFGIQIEDEKSLYMWFGMSQLYLSGGFGLRLPGGALELGTYSEDIGEDDTPEESRRFMFRYTIGL